jgi:hypothetical protein
VTTYSPIDYGMETKMTTVMRWAAAGLPVCSMVTANAAEKPVFQLGWLPGGDKSADRTFLK